MVLRANASQKQIRTQRWKREAGWPHDARVHAGIYHKGTDD